MSAHFKASHSLLVSQIRTFLEAYRNERKTSKKKVPPTSSALNSFSSFFDSSFADPTTLNALNTSTVVLRKKKDNSLKNSPFDGVRLSNYRLRREDVPREVFDWVSHFLWLKNCPLELATIIATHVSSRMSQETTRKDEDISSNWPELNPALASPDSSGLRLDLSAMDTDNTDFASRSSLPSALCSVDVARKSREMVDEYIEELGANPEQTVDMVQDYINSPNGDASPSTPTGQKGFTSSLCAIKNGRKTMEDRHIIIHDLNKALNIQSSKQYSYYAIFDGHAGVDAASYSTAHLHHNLVSSAAFAEGRIEDAFREAFEITDSLYVKRCKEDGVDQLKASGTTALCALIEDNKTVYLAWVGDSQAVLVRNGCHEEIMLPHKPDLDSERTRIQDLGGLVVFVDTWRVNGVLSVTRAIGDPDHKPYINAEPSLAKFEIDSSLDFLVLGCDGLFDQLTGQDIASHVFEFLCKNENRDPQEVIYDVSAYLSQMAIREGSSDNITSIVLFFKPFEQLVATGFPVEGETEVAESAKVVEASPVVSALPATNGGHFPYTDFSELPVGTNFNLHSMSEPAPLEQFEFNNDDKPNMANPFEDNLAANDEALFETSDFTFISTAPAPSAPTDASVPATDWSQFEEPAHEQPHQQEETPILQSEPGSSPFEADVASQTLQSTIANFTESTESQQVNENTITITTEDSGFTANPFKMDEVNELAEQLMNTSLTSTDFPSDKVSSPTAGVPARNPFALNNATEEILIATVNEDNNVENSNLPDVAQTSNLLGNEAESGLSTEASLLESEAAIETVESSHVEPSCSPFENRSFSNDLLESEVLPSTPLDVSSDIEPKEEENAKQQPDTNEAVFQLEPESIVEATAPEPDSTSASTALVDDFAEQAANEPQSAVFDAHPSAPSDIESTDKSNDLVSVENKVESLPAEVVQEDLCTAANTIEESTANAPDSSHLLQFEPQQAATLVNFDEPVEAVSGVGTDSTPMTFAPDYIETIALSATESHKEPVVQAPTTELLVETVATSVEDTTPIVENKAEEEAIPDLEPSAQVTETIPTLANDEVQVEAATSSGDVAAHPEPSAPAVETKPEEKIESEKASKFLPTKPKGPSAIGTKKPVAASAAAGAAKSKIATTSKVSSTLSKPAAATKAGAATASRIASKTATSTTAARPTAAKVGSTKPAATSSTLSSKPSTSTLTARLPSSSRLGTTTASRLATSKPAATTSAATTSRTGIASRTTTTTAGSRPTPTVPKAPTSRLATSTTRPLTTAAKTAAASSTESKPGITKRTVPSSTVSSRLSTGTTKPSPTTATRPNLAKTTATSSTVASRTTRSPATASAVSKVGSIRPTASTTKPSPKASPSVAAAKSKPTTPSTTPKPVNGVSATNGTKAVRKPTPVSGATKVPSATKTPESRATTQPNGAVKSYSAKRTIGVENSLKQELEDAVMNGQNGSINGGGSVPAPTAEEVPNVNGVNGHTDQ